GHRSHALRARVDAARARRGSRRPRHDPASRPATRRGFPASGPVLRPGARPSARHPARGDRAAPSVCGRLAQGGAAQEQAFGAREGARRVDRGGGAMRLVIWHTDPYPTAPGVYLGAFPAMGHRITWVVSSEGERHQIVIRKENGVRVIDIQRPRDSRLPKPWGALVNRWNKLGRLFVEVAWRRRLAAEHPDVLQVRELITEGTIGLFWAKRYRVPYAFQWDF